MECHLLRYVFHTLPVFAAFFEQWNLIAAAVVLVLVPYIKTMKLMSQAADHRDRGVPELSDELTRAANRWRSVTFMRKL
jgi:hypothetical protein